MAYQARTKTGDGLVAQGALSRKKAERDRYWHRITHHEGLSKAMMHLLRVMDSCHAGVLKTSSYHVAKMRLFVICLKIIPEHEQCATGTIMWELVGRIQKSSLISNYLNHTCSLNTVHSDLPERINKSRFSWRGKDGRRGLGCTVSRLLRGAPDILTPTLSAGNFLIVFKFICSRCVVRDTFGHNPLPCNRERCSPLTAAAAAAAEAEAWLRPYSWHVGQACERGCRPTGHCKH